MPKQVMLLLFLNKNHMPFLLAKGHLICWLNIPSPLKKRFLDLIRLLNTWMAHQYNSDVQPLHKMVSCFYGVFIPSIGFIERIKGQGMPKHMYPDERGDLFVEYQVAMPIVLTDKQKAGTVPYLLPDSVV